ncbi:JAB domain-containing protein [Rhizobium esperanzae]|uniref:DNA repair protein RadC n=1 Tax=Rhizobium esperanzae TaxID=1967781 RepID=A0A7W6R751_9HYPH|nr:DNA repair protein RadC [Rhizobium esperanzae]
MLHRQHGLIAGDPAPSRTDIKTTKVIIDAAKAFDIIVQDHVIIGWAGHLRLKGLKLIRKAQGGLNRRP